MKKAKIMLTSIAVLAVVGGALAFKVKADANVYCKISGVCTKVAYTTQGYNQIPRPATTTNPCPDEDFFYTDPACPVTTSFAETLNTVTTTNL